MPRWKMDKWVRKNTNANALSIQNPWFKGSNFTIQIKASALIL